MVSLVLQSQDLAKSISFLENSKRNIWCKNNIIFATKIDRYQEGELMKTDHFRSKMNKNGPVSREFATNVYACLTKEK